MNVKHHTRSFAGGEITPELYGRIDLTKFQTGLSKALNFEVLPHGPVQNSSGFAFVNEVKDSSKATRVIPFSYNTQQTFSIEFGDQYIRWHTNGGTLLEASQAPTGISVASPAVWTRVAHGYAVDQWVYVAGVTGTFGVRVNGRFLKINTVPTADTYTLKDMAGVVINSTGYTVTAAGTTARVYEIASTYLEADLMALHFVQSEDVLTITHPSYPPRQLSRLAATNWTLANVSFVPSVSAPTAVAVTASPASGTPRTRYKVTTVAQDGLEESLASIVATVGAGTAITGVTQANPGVVTSVAHGRAVGDGVYITGVLGMTQLSGEYLVNTVPTANTLTLKTLSGVVVDTTAYGAWTSGGTVFLTDVVNDLAVATNRNTVAWDAAASAVRYNVYKLKNGLYGYIGQTDITSFVDDNITPDLAKTPAITNTPFASATNYPNGIGYYESRRVFGGTTTKPQNYWLTRSATESNLSYSIPTRDDDTIQGRLKGPEVNSIRHIVTANEQLVFLTSGGVWKLTPSNSDILTPTSALPKQVEGEGASNVQPAKTASEVVYIGEAETRLFAIKYKWESNGLVTEELSLMAPHLFEGYTLLDTTYSKAGKQIWTVRSDGALIGTTYLPKHDVNAMYTRTTDGIFESVCSVKEGAEYPVYAVIRRTINGRTVRTIERKHTRFFTDPADQFFVDCGLTYDSTPATVFYVWHLVGKTVAILADGAEVAPQVVTADGTITLDDAASVVHIGLPIIADMQGLPLVLEALMAAGQGTLKNVSEVWLRVSSSGGIKAGPDFNHLRELPARSNENYNTAPTLKNGVVRITLDNDWALDARICVRQTAPLALTISSMTLLVAAGG